MSLVLAQPSRPAMLAVSASEALLRIERVAVAGLMAVLTALILVNVATRYGGMPIYWIDEMAVYTTVWLTFIGASAMTRLRLDFAVTLLTEYLSPGAAKAARALSTLCVLLFALGFLGICWTWLDPIGIARANFDARDYAAETFNFIYTEHTQTLNWPNWVLYLVLPLFATTLSLHCCANLLEDLGLVPPPPKRAGLSDNAETVA